MAHSDPDRYYPFVHPSEFPVELAMMLAIWVEAFLYGIYTCLFCKTLYITFAKKGVRGRSRKYQAVLAAKTLMFAIATCDVCVNLYRLAYAFVWWTDPSGPATYFLDVRRWDHVVNSLNFCLMMWLGDALVLYRCFVVWGRNYGAVLLPMLLLVLSSTTNAAVMVWFSHPPNVSLPRLIAWVDSIYVVNLVQNILTTSLIVFRIMHQHHVSAAAGAWCIGAQLQLTHVVRVLVESAALYTVQLVVLLVLHTRRHNAQFIVQFAIIPTIGLTFNLVSVRTQSTKSETGRTTSVDPCPRLPQWTNECVSTELSGSSDPSIMEPLASPSGVRPGGSIVQSESLGRRSACRRPVES